MSACLKQRFKPNEAACQFYAEKGRNCVLFYSLDRSRESEGQNWPLGCVRFALHDKAQYLLL